jgi:threonine aldolase
MTICLSKSLSCPTGAMVIGDKKFIDKLRVIRKSLGGTMRQVGILTAAGLWAMHHMPK